MTSFAELTKDHSNRHAGVRSNDCNCGLVHDDELKTRPERRQEVVIALGGKCANPKCRWLNEDGTLGCNDPIYLQVDHIFDDGYLEKRIMRSGSYWHKVLRELHRYQLLCANCNWAKRQQSAFSRANCAGGFENTT